MTKGELARYRDALLKDSEHLAAMIDNVPSVDNLDFIMESDALGHKVMDQVQGHESLVAVAGTITLEEVFLCFTSILMIHGASSYILTKSNILDKDLKL